MKNILKLGIISSLLFISSQNIAYSGTVSFDQLATSSDLTVSKWNSDMNTIYQKVNSQIQTDNIEDDTLTEADMADEINPRVRTKEGAACELVYTGLLPAVNAGSLTTNISAGTAYPQGFRVNKASATQKTYTATKWTFVDIDQNGDFQYSEVAIEAATPSVATNAIRLARVSTDSSGVQVVTDLRATSCAAGPFSDIKDTATEASLEDMFLYGQQVRRFSKAGRTPEGWATGLYVSYDSHTQFIVTKGSAYINGEFRFISNDLTVTQTTDNPAQGNSGLDTGSVEKNKKYYIYAVADQPSVSSLTISYSKLGDKTPDTGGVPTGLSNYRLIGSINTDNSGGDPLFTSNDPVTAHALSEREIVGGWISFNGTSGIVSRDAFNVSAIADNGTGDYTVTWDVNFNSANYAVVEGAQQNSNDVDTSCPIEDATAPTISAVRVECANGGTPVDPPIVNIVAFGDTRK